MLCNLNEVFEFNKNHATGAFNITSLEVIQAVISAGEELNKAVIISYADVHSVYNSLDQIGDIMVSEAKKAKIPVCVHLDHASNPEICKKAIDIGFTSVMYDASHKEFTENVAESLDMVSYAHKLNVTVEAELGNILVHDEKTLEHGESDDSDLDKIYTDPTKALEFVNATNVDALAIAFGTVHGVYRKKPVLDLARITKIAEKVSTPLVMHGGSGLSKEDFQTAIKNGIKKINYYTYLSLAGGTAVSDFVSQNSEVYYHDIATVARTKMKNEVLDVIKIFSLEV